MSYDNIQVFGNFFREEDRSKWFQTKDLECNYQSFSVDSDGTLHITVEVGVTTPWPVTQDVEIYLYGKDDLWRAYVLTFVFGKCVEVKLADYDGKSNCWLDGDPCEEG